MSDSSVMRHSGCLHPHKDGTLTKHNPSEVTHDPVDYHATIDSLADELEQKYIGIRHDIHQHPELGNREFRTSKIISDHLTSLGFNEVHTGVGKTGVVGVLKGGLPGDKVVGLRADFDALPVKELADVPFKSTVVDKDYPGGPFPVSHACGHDTHAAMLMAACEILVKMKDQIAGTVKVIFQPAEEGPPLGEAGGASLMVKDGALENPKPDTVFTVHSSPYPLGEVIYTPGPAMAASELIKITVEGMGVHGSTPWMGKDPMTVSAEIIMALAQIYRQVPATEPITISIGKLVDHGRFNVIGDDIVMYGTVRCTHGHVMDDVNTRITRIVKYVSKAHGLTGKVEYDQQVPAVINEPSWVKRFLPTLERVAGAQNMKKGPPTLAYDDASVFQNACGGIYILLGGQNTKWEADGKLVAIDGSPVPFNHNPHFYVNDKMLKLGTRAHCNVVFDFLNGKI